MSALAHRGAVCMRVRTCAAAEPWPNCPGAGSQGAIRPDGPGRGATRGGATRASTACGSSSSGEGGTTTADPYSATGAPCPCTTRCRLCGCGRCCWCRRAGPPSLLPACRLAAIQPAEAEHLRAAGAAGEPSSSRLAVPASRRPYAHLHTAALAAPRDLHPAACCRGPRQSLPAAVAAPQTSSKVAAAQQYAASMQQQQLAAQGAVPTTRAALLKEEKLVRFGAGGGVLGGAGQPVFSCCGDVASAAALCPHHFMPRGLCTPPLPRCSDRWPSMRAGAAAACASARAAWSASKVGPAAAAAVRGHSVCSCCIAGQARAPPWPPPLPTASACLPACSCSRGGGSGGQADAAAAAAGAAGGDGGGAGAGGAGAAGGVAGQGGLASASL